VRCAGVFVDGRERGPGERLLVDEHSITPRGGAAAASGVTPFARPIRLMVDLEEMVRRGLLVVSVLCTAGLSWAPRGECKGKSYVIKGMGTHYTGTGKEIRKRKVLPKLKLVELRTGAGFVVANTQRAWGTQLAVYQINRIMAYYERQFPKAPPVIVRDLSKRGGGVLDNHNSHLDGRDVDIQLPLDVQDVADKRPRTVNVEGTWFLVKALAESCSVEYVFLDRQVQKELHEHALTAGVKAQELSLILQYPRSERETMGVVRHWTNHQDHLHVRFGHERAPLLPTVKAYCDWRKQSVGR
jgi:hypothetical protein